MAPRLEVAKVRAFTPRELRTWCERQPIDTMLSMFPIDFQISMHCCAMKTTICGNGFATVTTPYRPTLYRMSKVGASAMNRAALIYWYASTMPLDSCLAILGYFGVLGPEGSADQRRRIIHVQELYQYYEGKLPPRRTSRLEIAPGVSVQDDAFVSKDLNTVWLSHGITCPGAPGVVKLSDFNQASRAMCQVQIDSRRNKDAALILMDIASRWKETDPLAALQRWGE